MTQLQTALSTARDLSSRAKEVRARLANEQFTLSGYDEWRKANDDWDAFARTFTEQACTALEEARKHFEIIEGNNACDNAAAASERAMQALAAMERAFAP